MQFNSCKPKTLTGLSTQIKYLGVLLTFTTFSGFCQEVKVKGTIDSKAYFYESEIAEQDPTQTKSIVLKPSLTASFASRKLQMSFTANHSKVKEVDSDDLLGDSDSTSETETSNNSSDKDFTDYKFTSSLSVIDNVLTLGLNGSQSYQNRSQQQEGFSDIIVNSNNLTKRQNYGALVNLSVPNPSYLGFNLQSRLQNTKTSQTIDNETGLDNKNIGITSRIYNGKDVRFINFDFTTQYRDTSRTNFQNFKSTRANGQIGLPLFSDLEFVVTGSLEEYDTGQASFFNRVNLDTHSYGAGINWRPSDSRQLALTYNRLTENDKETDFLGVDLNWAFSSRTSVNLDYGKRFYGDSYSFGLKHATKSIRTSVSYSEELTTYSRLGESTTNITGIFVCEFGATDLAECFQPDSLDYQLAAGEQFRATTEVITDINEEVMLRKMGTASIGYEKRKFKVSLNANYQHIEYLESDRERTNNRVSLSVNYSLGRKSNISLVTNIAENKYSELDAPDLIKTTTLNFNRSITRYLKFNLSASVLDRQSDSFERNRTDNRLTLGLNYRFE
ncbi:TIGR03016 family PEP-CTERM system-associated outer membrane protein [Paraglaciecola aestuariivivens]